MIFKKRDRFLIRIYFFQVNQGQYVVKDSVLSSDLKAGYKQLYQWASFWEKKGCLTLLTERGGRSEFQLTDLGKNESVNLAKKLRLKKIILGGFFVLVLCGFFFLK
ncbi:hypothetical protein DID78_00815 [Candidatus Marinamargulisbacteria bacterium SCGC AG-343-D04]|nr:hypothetical protein DID78_00815 [Candidatus Marinamargulisbacteria bacterium SCGC AG-343-D04]